MNITISMIPSTKEISSFESILLWLLALEGQGLSAMITNTETGERMHWTDLAVPELEALAPLLRIELALRFMSENCFNDQLIH